MMQISTLQEQINKLKQIKKQVIVEGKKDQKALREFGINSISLTKPLYEIVELVSKKHKECIILTDLDKQGKKVYSKLRHNLQKNGVKIDNKFRNFLFKHTKLTNIEALPKYLKKLQKL